MSKKETVRKSENTTERTINILYCQCDNEFQDKENGPGRRVHNKGVKGWICTVCGKEKLFK